MDAVGRDVRHRSDHAVGGQFGGGLFVGFQPVIVGRVDHPQPLPGDGGVTSHADEHPGALGIGDHVRQRLTGGRQHHRLLAEAPGEFVRRKAKSGKIERDAVERGRCCLRPEHSATECLGIAGVPGDHTESADDDVVGGRLRPVHRGAWPPVVLDDQVRIVAAEAEVAHRRPFDRPVPRGGGGHQGERRVAQLVGRRLAHGRRNRRGLHGGQHVHQTRGAGHRDGVAQIAFQRTEFQRHIAIGGCDALQLGGIAERGAGGVAVHIVDVGRCQPGLFERRGHGPGLTTHRGCQEAALPAVIRESDTQDHTEDVVAGAFGVLEAFERDQRRALRRHQTIGLGVEGPRLPRRAERLQRRETQMQEQIVRSVHTAGEHHVGVAVVQRVAGQFDGVERGCARRVQCVDRPIHLHRPGNQVHRQARGEPVARVVVALTGPKGFHERGAHGARVRQVADDQPGPRCGERPSQRLLGALGKPRHDRIELVEIGYPRGEVAQVERRLDVAARRRRDAQPLLVTGQQLCRVHPAPLIARGGCQQAASGQGCLEQLFRSGRAGQHTTASDNCDGFEPAHAEVSAAPPAA